MDHSGYCVIGGSVENLQNAHVESNYRDGLSLSDAVKLGREALQRAENGTPDLPGREPRGLRARARPVGTQVPPARLRPEIASLIA